MITFSGIILFTSQNSKLKLTCVSKIHLLTSAPVMALFVNQEIMKPNFLHNSDSTRQFHRVKDQTDYTHTYTYGGKELPTIGDPCHVLGHLPSSDLKWLRLIFPISMAVVKPNNQSHRVEMVAECVSDFNSVLFLPIWPQGQRRSALFMIIIMSFSDAFVLHWFVGDAFRYFYLVVFLMFWNFLVFWHFVFEWWCKYILFL